MTLEELQVRAASVGCVIHVDSPCGRVLREEGAYRTWWTVELRLHGRLVAGANACELADACEDAWTDFVERAAEALEALAS